MGNSLSILQIAGSALNAQSQRMNAVASNLANADSVAGPDGTPYKAKKVVFQMDPVGDEFAQAPIGGVKVAKLTESEAAPRRTYDPKNPSADKDGYVTFSNVDPVTEMVDMISASRSYQANVEVINTAKSLMMRTLTIGQ